MVIVKTKDGSVACFDSNHYILGATWLELPTNDGHQSSKVAADQIMWFKLEPGNTDPMPKEIETAS